MNVKEKESVLCESSVSISHRIDFILIE